LNIFYNREAELKYLKRVLKKERLKKDLAKKEKKEWLAKQKQKFYSFLKDMENKRRRNKKNLVQRKLFKAKQLFSRLWNMKEILPKKINSRLKMIKKNWKFFTTFYSIKNCPATNNSIENYYSTSLKTHRKKQLRTKKGIINHMKLASMKREGKILCENQIILKFYKLFALVTS
jgi:hypothetical protein